MARFLLFPTVRLAKSFPINSDISHIFITCIVDKPKDKKLRLLRGSSQIDYIIRLNQNDYGATA